MVYWIPSPHKHRKRHQYHRNRMSFSRFTVKNVFWWRPSLISNFRRKPLECRRVSREFLKSTYSKPPWGKVSCFFPEVHTKFTYPPHYTAKQHKRRNARRLEKSGNALATTKSKTFQSKRKRVIIGGDVLTGDTEFTARDRFKVESFLVVIDTLTCEPCARARNSR